MKTTTITLAVIALALLASPAPAEPGEELDGLRMEFEAVTEAISAQVRLVRIYEEMGKPKDAAETRKQVVELVARARKILDEIGRACGEAPVARVRVRAVPSNRTGGNAPGGDRPFHAGGSAKNPAEAVSRALTWLAAVQDPAGYWDSDGFSAQLEETPKERAGGGYALYDPGVTGLAVLAFLGAGETHKSGSFRDTVKGALQYLKQIQDPEGCFGPRTTNHFTYNHAICAWAMSEAYAMTASPLFKASAQFGIDFIHKAQNPYLAWRYGVRPQDNDSSVTGWMVAALASARAAGLRVSDETFSGAKAWLDKVTEPEYGRVGYTARGTGPARPQDQMDKFPSDKSEALTAEGILIRTECGEDPGKSELIQKGVLLCLKVKPTWNLKDGSIDMYYWFWAARALSRVGGEAWTAFRQPLRQVVLASQSTRGQLTGSWDPAGPWGRDGGRIYSTALMTMIAEVLDRSE